VACVERSLLSEAIVIDAHRALTRGTPCLANVVRDRDGISAAFARESKKVTEGISCVLKVYLFDEGVIERMNDQDG
jgi:hypothetical protein